MTKFFRKFFFKKALSGAENPPNRKSDGQGDTF